MTALEGVWLEIRTPLAPKGIFPTRRTDSRSLTCSHYTASQLPTENIVLTMSFNRLPLPTLEVLAFRPPKLSFLREQCRGVRKPSARKNGHEVRINGGQL